MNVQYQRDEGFTIVELLIVIVVIAILAAITIVAYNGLQTKAYNANVLSGVRQAQTAIQSFKIVNGTYPAVSADPNDDGVPACLGEGFANGSCGSYTFSGCAPYFSDGSTIQNNTESSYLNDQFKSFFHAPLPAITSPPLTIVSKDAFGTLIPGCDLTLNVTGLTYATYQCANDMSACLVDQPDGSSIQYTTLVYYISYPIKGDAASTCGLADASDAGASIQGWKLCSLSGGY